MVPGEYITKIELEEFESQLSAEQKEELGLGGGGKRVVDVEV